MNVLVLSHMFPSPLDPCAGIFVLEQAKALRKAGVTVQVVSPTPWAPRLLNFYPSVRKYSVVPRCWTVDDFVVQYPRVPTLPNNIGFFLSGILFYLSCRGLIAKLCREHAISLIHAHTVFPDGFAAVLLGQELCLPVICTAHGSDVNVYPLRSRVVRKASQWSLRHADRVIAVSENLRNEALALASLREITVVRNGATSTTFQPLAKTEARSKLKLRPDGKLVSFIGYLRPEKGIHYLLEAFSALHRSDTRLCIVGDGPSRDSLIASAKRLGIIADCVFPGKRPHSEIPLWMTASDCLVLPSLSEGFPAILPEAMLCGTPIIATPVGGIPEAVCDGETGWLVPGGKPSAITQALLTLLSDEPLARDIAVRAQKMARESLTWDANAKRMVTIYQDVIGQLGARTSRARRHAELQSLSIH